LNHTRSRSNCLHPRTALDARQGRQAAKVGQDPLRKCPNVPSESFEGCEDVIFANWPGFLGAGPGV